MFQRLALFVLLSAPALASASFTVTESHNTDGIINRVEFPTCGDTGSVTDNIYVSWTYSSWASGGTYTLKASLDGDCPSDSDDSSANTVTLLSAHSFSSASGRYPVSGTFTATSLLNAVGITTCDPSYTYVYFCVDYTDSSSDTTDNVVTGSIKLDFAVPPAPEDVSLQAGDTVLYVSWEAGTGTADGGTGSPDSWNIYCGEADGGTMTLRTSVSGGSTYSGTVEGLTDGITYDVAVSAVTEGGNEGSLSTVVSGTPVVVYDFWRYYKYEGGKEGGCAAGAGGLLALLAVVPLALRRGKGRR